MIYNIISPQRTPYTPKIRDGGPSPLQFLVDHMMNLTNTEIPDVFVIGDLAAPSKIHSYHIWCFWNPTLTTTLWTYNEKHLLQQEKYANHGTNHPCMVYFRILFTYIYVDFYGLNVGKYIPVPWILWVGQTFIQSKPPDVAPFGHCPVVHPVGRCVHRAGPGILRAFRKKQSSVESIDWR